jgi:pseudouridine-5'-monophosphatase
MRASTNAQAKMMGKKAHEAAEVLISEWQLQGVLTPEAFLAEREAALDSLFPTSQLMPGAERLLRHLHRHGVPFCLATSSHHRHYCLKTSSHGELFDLFSHRITGEPASQAPPPPRP